MADGSSLLIFDSQDRVLLVKRRDYPIWNFPGGGVELGESPLQAAVREGNEETGFSLRFSKPQKIYIRILPSGKKAHYFKSQFQSGCFTRNFEASDGKFFSQEQLPRTFPTYFRHHILKAINHTGKPYTIKANPIPYRKILLEFWYRPDIILRYFFFKFVRKVYTRIQAHQYGQV